MPRSTNLSVATMGIDIGKNSFHVVGLDQRSAIVVRQRWTRNQIRAANTARSRGSRRSTETDGPGVPKTEVDFRSLSASNFAST